jgi:AraC family transcriptional regulator
LKDLKVESEAAFKPNRSVPHLTRDLNSDEWVMTEPRVSHGRRAGSINLGPYTVTEAFYSPNQKVPLHAHAFASWTLVLGGLFEERFARRDVLCSPGVVLTKSATADHSNSYGPRGAHCLLIETRDAGSGSYTKSVFRDPTVFSRGTIPVLAHRIYQEFQSTAPLSEFSLEALLIELAGATDRSVEAAVAPRKKAWLNSVRDQLEAEFRSPPSLATLAAAYHVHPVYLCQAFRAAFGLSVGQFVRTVRFEWARESLRIGTTSIADIAFAAGYSDQAHLSRDFRRKAGISPYRFRAEANRPHE